MRSIILSIVIGVVGCAALTPNVNHADSKIILYVFNDDGHRPGQILEDEFWETPGELDTIEIKGKRLVDLYKQKFNALKDTALFEPDEIDLFPHRYAFVFTNGNSTDTIYSNRQLYLFKWKVRNAYYTDPARFFRKHFDAFLIN